MCFSSQASFLAATGLSIVGIFTLLQIRQRSQYMFAAIPLLFSLQQLSEGILWLSQPNSLVYKFAYNIFLIFAFAIWPSWVPISLWLMEKIGWRKKVLFLLSIFGLIWSFCSFYILATQAIEVKILCQHIYYHVPIFFDNFRTLSFLLYCSLTILPFFVSSQKIMWIFGLCGALSCIISYLLWSQFIISVWCFFAAILSLFIFFIVRMQNK